MSGVDHLGFIAAAYGVAGLTLIVTLAALLLDNRAQRRLLARFNANEDSRP